MHEPNIKIYITTYISAYMHACPTSNQPIVIMYPFCLCIAYIPGTHNQFELTPILSVGIFIGVLTALMCIALGTVAAIKLRTAQHRRRQHHQQHGNHGKGKPNTNNISRPGNLPIKEKISLPLSQSEEMYDEKNPDVVPYNEGNFINFIRISTNVKGWYSSAVYREFMCVVSCVYMCVCKGRLWYTY